MKKLFIVFAFIILIIIAVPRMNSKDSVKIEDINFNDSREMGKNISKLAEDTDLDLEVNSKVIRALLDIKWDKLKEEEVPEVKANMAQWIYDLEIDGKEEIDSIIKVSRVFTDDEYIKILEKLTIEYGKEMDEFIKALSENKDMLIDLGYSFYDLELYGTNGRSISEDFLYIRDSDKLTEEEKQLGYEFLEIISSCDT
ncbi:MAG TPA: hypothetical protein VFC60_02560 [Tissierellaceae bacterium]|nr:hypothetical protein [Tissierellaceae bacterium]